MTYFQQERFYCVRCYNDLRQFIRTIREATRNAQNLQNSMDVFPGEGGVIIIAPTQNSTSLIRQQPLTYFRNDAMIHYQNTNFNTPTAPDAMDLTDNQGYYPHHTNINEVISIPKTFIEQTSKK